MKMNFNFNWELYDAAASAQCHSFVLLPAVVERDAPRSQRGAETGNSADD
jgi:hypothetical protein